jgi:AraC family transcriptional regulator
MDGSPGARTYNGSLLRECDADGIRLLEVRYDADEAIATHAHPHAGFSMLLGGSLSELYRGRSLDWSEGSVGFHPADEEHSNRTLAAGAHVLIVELATPWLERARAESVRPERSLVAGFGPLPWLGARLLAESRVGDSASRLAVQGIALEMLAALARRGADACEDGLPPWLRRARELLHAHFAEPLSLAAVAERVDAPPVRLARAFRKAHGCSVGEYLRRLRIEEARQRLAGSGAPISEVASSAGFCDQAHLSRVFKKATGLTPLAYRELVRPVPKRPKR